MIDSAEAVDELVEQLRALEHERCRAISAQDLDSLERLLDPELMHTHVTGVTQDLTAYLSALSGRPRVTECGEISVTLGADMAVLSGTITNVFGSGAEPRRGGEMHALRVWRRGESGWRMIAFAASGPLGPAPPVRPDA